MTNFYIKMAPNPPQSPNPDFPGHVLVKLWRVAPGLDPKVPSPMGSGIQSCATSHGRTMPISYRKSRKMQGFVGFRFSMLWVTYSIFWFIIGLKLPIKAWEWFPILFLLFFVNFQFLTNYWTLDFYLLQKSFNDLES